MSLSMIKSTKEINLENNLFSEKLTSSRALEKGVDFVLAIANILKDLIVVKLNYWWLL